MKWFSLVTLTFTSYFLTAPALHAQSFLDLADLSPFTEYQTFDTEHFTLTFPIGFETFSKKAADELEFAHQILSPLLKWQPRGKTHVLISDNQDAANGFAMPPLRVGMVLLATPPDTFFSTAHTDDWIRLLVFHEYVHILNIDPTTEWMEWIRIFYGDVIKPNGLWPTWMLEGLAVYFETRNSSLGRGRSPYYESILRAFVKDQKFNSHSGPGITLDRVNGEFPYFPGGETPYLFGYHLWQELSLSEPFSDSLMGEYSLRSSARVPFFINGNMENLTEKTWDDYWAGFVMRTQRRMADQVAQLKAEGATEPKLITQSGYSAFGGELSPDGQFIAYTETTQEKRQSVVILNRATGEKTWVDDKILGGRVAWTPDSKFLIYSALRRFDNFYLYSDLLSYHVPTGHIEQITFGSRAKDPAISQNGQDLVYVKNKDAQNLLVHAKLTVDTSGAQPRITLSQARIIYQPRPCAILGQPRFEKDQGHVIFSEQNIGSPASDIMRFSIASNASSSGVSTLFHDGYRNRYPFPTKDGILFVSDLNGIQNIYRLDVNQKVERVTHSFTDIVLPFQDESGKVMGSVITSEGIEIAEFTQLPRGTTEVVNPVIPNARESLLDASRAASKSESSSTQDYEPFSSLAPRQWAPIAYIKSDSINGTSIFGDVLGFDSTGKHQYFFLAGHQFKTGTWDADLTYTYYGFLPKLKAQLTSETHSIGSGRNGDQYRRTHQAALFASYPFYWTYSRLIPTVYGFLEWNRIFNSNTGDPVATRLYEYSKEKIPGLGLQVVFSDIESSALGFIPERGQEAKIATEARMNENETTTLWKMLLSYSRNFPLGGHQVIKPKIQWIGSTHFFNSENSGVVTGDQRSTSLNQVGVRGYPNVLWLTKSATVLSTDYSFPIRPIFQGFGTWPAFMNQLYATGFVESAFLPTRTLGTVSLPTVGASLTLKTTLLIRAPINFILSVAQGLNSTYGGASVFGLSIQADDLI